MFANTNDAVIFVLLEGIKHEHERISRAQAEIARLKEELLDLGFNYETVFNPSPDPDPDLSDLDIDRMGE